MQTTKYIINELSAQTITGDLNVIGNLSGSTFYGDGSNLTGLYGGFTGGTVSGTTNFTNGLSANTISATTYYNLPTLTGGTEFTGGTVSGSTTFTNGVSGNTVSADKFYGDGSNIAGLVGLGYDDLGFTITSLPVGINQDVVLPYGATVTYPTPLIMNNGYILTIPSGTTLTII